MSDLIKPKEIKIHSALDNVDYELRIGRYPGLEAVELLGDGAYLVQMTARNDPKFGAVLKEKVTKILSYVEIKAPNGEWIRLSDPNLINLYLGDGEAILSIAKEVHDYSANFFSTTNLLKTSHKFLDQLKAQATKTFRGLSDSLLAKVKRASKS